MLSFAYYKEIGRQFGESKGMCYESFMATLREESSLGGGPDAKLSLSLSSKPLQASLLFQSTLCNQHPSSFPFQSAFQ